MDQFFNDNNNYDYEETKQNSDDINDQNIEQNEQIKQNDNTDNMEQNIEHLQNIDDMEQNIEQNEQNIQHSQNTEYSQLQSNNNITISLPQYHKKKHKYCNYIDKQSANEYIFDEQYNELERIFREIQDICDDYGHNFFKNTTTLDFYLFINQIN